MNIKLEENGIKPTKEFPSSIGFDLFIPNDVIVERGRSVVCLNFRIDVPKNQGVLIMPRSGTSAKGMLGYNIMDGTEGRFDCDVRLGLIDPRYKGMVGMMVYNHDNPFKLKRGQSVAQMLVVNSNDEDLTVVDDFDLGGERGEQGFNA